MYFWGKKQMTVPIASIIKGNVSEANEKEKEVKLKSAEKYSRA